MVLLPSLTQRHSGGIVGLATVLQQQFPSQMPLQAYANYAMAPPQVGFSFRVEPPTVLYVLYVWCLFWSMICTFRYHAGCYIHLWGLNFLGLHHCNPLGLTHGRHMCNLVMVISDRVAAPSIALRREELHATQSAVPQASQLYGRAYSFGGLAESHLIPPP